MQCVAFRLKTTICSLSLAHSTHERAIAKDVHRHVTGSEVDGRVEEHVVTTGLRSGRSRQRIGCTSGASRPVEIRRRTRRHSTQVVRFEVADERQSCFNNNNKNNIVRVQI